MPSGAKQHFLKGNNNWFWWPLFPLYPYGSRNTVFSELDYGCYPVSDKLNINVNDARIFMIRNHKWKYIYYKGFDAQLFDLENDPNEFNDLGTSSTYSDIRKTMKDLLLDRLISRKNRVTQEDDVYAGMKRDDNKKGIIIGRW